jgi:hypothetical protein
MASAAAANKTRSRGADSALYARFFSGLAAAQVSCTVHSALVSSCIHKDTETSARAQRSWCLLRLCDLC